MSYLIYDSTVHGVYCNNNKNIIRSNNKKNNYMNQLLRLPLLKYTTEKKYMC